MRLRPSALVAGTAVVAAPFAVSGPVHAASGVVTNLDDSGPGSLRDAIEAANLTPGSETITFAAGLSGTITLTSGQIEVTDSVTILGPGASTITVDGGGNDRVLYLYGSAAAPLDVEIRDITISGGNATQGGGISAIGTDLRLRYVGLRGNSATTRGGGLFFDAARGGDGELIGSLSVQGSDIIGNTSDQSGGGIQIGTTGGDVQIAASFISGNVAGTSGGGVAVTDAAHHLYLGGDAFDSNRATEHGGALYLGSSSGGGLTLVVDGFTNNTAGGTGGAVHVGMEAAPAGTDVVVWETGVAGNRSGGDGGGVYVFGGGDRVLVTRSSLTANVSGGAGGALALGVDARVFTMENSTISGNAADLDGGGISLQRLDGTGEVRHSTITRNQSFASAGGLSSQEAPVHFSHTVLSGNTSVDGHADLDSPKSGTAFAADWSIIGDSTPLASSSHVVATTDPQLGPLEQVADFTLAHTPLPGSPAAEGGDPQLLDAPDGDQRNVARILGVVDVGAIETGARDDEYDATEGTTLTVDDPDDGVLDNDTPQAEGATAELVSGPAHGTLDLAADGTFVYTPAPGYSGDDSFVYRLRYGNVAGGEATVRISIASTNQAPVAVDDDAVARAGFGTDIAVLVNDRDPDGDTLAVQSVTSPARGTAVVVGTTVRYTPNPGVTSGSDTFTYTVTDGSLTATATVRVTISPSSLPATGGDSDIMLAMASVLTAAGAAMSLLPRVRRR